MLSKNVLNKTCLVSETLKKSFGSRLARELQTENGSYFHNPGSEPLTIATLGEVIADTVHKYPGRVAVRSVHEDLTLTYEELLNRADSLGCALRAQGFQKGDRLGLWTHNCVGWVVGCVAAARAGLISVLLNPVYEKAELSFSINKTKLKGLMIADTLKNRNYYGLLNELIPELQAAKEGSLKSKDFPSLTSVINSGKEKFSGIPTLDSLISDHKNNVHISKYGSEVKPEDGSLILLTSGTTGDPKAGLDSHLGVVNNVYFSGIRNSLNEGHPIVCVQAPLFHALGAIVTLLSSLRHGATVVLPAPTYSVTANVDAVCAEKCSIITGTPTMYLDMLEHVKRRADLPINLRVALAAGAPCSPQLIRLINKQLKVKSVRALYGLSETTACVFQSMPEDSVEVVAETVGYTTDHCEVKVIDDKGNTVPFGTAGELMVRGYHNMIGYWDDPAKTKQTLREDGWLHTGDKFTLSENGYGKIVGRLKDIIIRGGENIAPKEIEDLLNTHPDVIDSQVIGVPDERLGEELCAVVRLREGSSFTVQDLTNHCKGKLARYKIPRILKTMEDFPKTVSVTRVQLIDFRSYAISIIQRTMWKVEQRCWCNLKIDDIHVSLNENVLGDRIAAEIDLKNGFVVSVQKMDILEFSIQRGWLPSTVNTTMVNVRSTLRLLEVAMGFDVLTTMDEKTFHTTGMIVYPRLEFDFTITKHLVTNDITVDVVGRTIRHTNLMHFFPENVVTNVFAVLFDWNSTSPSVQSWARDIIRPITLELATKEIDFPRICYDCPV